MAGIHQNILNFSILETGNPKTLVFLDESVYMDLHPERPLLEVTMPGYEKYFLVNIEAREVNTLNANTLNLTAVLNQTCLIDLPDGIWFFKYKICPYDKVFICKNHIRVTALNEKLSLLHDKINLLDCDIKNDKSIETDLAKIYALIEGAKSVVSKDSGKAYSYYQTATKMVDNIYKQLNNC